MVERWTPRLTAHAWRLTGHREMARDAVQAGWVEIMRGLGRLRDDRAFPAWAYRIVSRCAAREIRKVARQREVGDALVAEGAHEAVSPAIEPQGAGEKARLQQAIRQLSPVQRAAVALYYFEEMTLAETAVALDAPVGTIKTRLMHARRKLRAILAEELDKGEPS